jgi:hypothetical protein
MDHKSSAEQLRRTRFHTYPSGGTAKSQAYAMMCDLQTILDCVHDHEDVPPWVIMKLSEAADAVSSASRYIGYTAQQNDK